MRGPITSPGAGILANALFRTTADIGSKVASIALYIVMARRLGEAQFGVFTFGLAFVTLVTTLASFGQDAILTREVARDRSVIDHYFANTLALCLSLALPALGLALIFSFAAGFDGETRAVVALLGIAVTADVLVNICGAVYQAYERMVFLPLVLIPQRAFTAAAGIVALLLGADVVVVAAIYAVFAVLALLLAISFVLGRIVRPRMTLEPRTWRALLLAALPVGLSGVFATVLFRVDTAMLAAYESDTIVGEYGAAYRLFESTLFVSWSVGAGLYPVLARLRGTPDRSAVLVFARGLKLVIAVTLPMATACLVLAEPILRLLYGDAYAEAATALRLLAPAIALFPVSYVTGYLLITQDRQRLLAFIYAVVAAENILLNLVLIPELSLDGAALGTSISQALVVAATLTAARATIVQVPWRRVLLGPVVAAGGATLVFWLLRDAPVLVAAAAGGVVHVAVLAAVEARVFPEDARAIRDFVTRRRPVEDRAG